MTRLLTLVGLTAWMTRLGTAIGGQHVLAIRMPFLLLAVLHIACVLIESRALGRNLVRPMTIGTKPPRGGA